MQFHKTSNVIIEQHASYKIIYGRWDRIFGVWKSQINTVVGAKDALPTWPLLNEADALLLKRDDDFNSLFSAYTNLIPEKYRQLASPLGHWQWIILEGIWTIPNFASFLHTEKVSRGLGFVVMCYLLNDPHCMNREERKLFNQKIMSQKRLKTLSEITSVQYSQQILKNLSKVDATTITLPQLKCLILALSDEHIARTISHLEVVSSDLIEALNSIKPWLLVPNVIRIIGQQFHSSVLLLDAFDSLNTLAQRLGNEAFEQQVITSLNHATNISELVTSIETWTEEEFVLNEDVGPFPPPPVQGSETLVPILTWLELMTEGRTMHHCVGIYASKVTMNVAYYYQWHGDERATVELIKSNKGKWIVGEVFGACNAVLEAKTINQINTIMKG